MFDLKFIVFINEKIYYETLHIFAFFIIHKKNTIKKIFDFYLLMDLLVLGCPEHDMTILGENVCLSMCFCEWYKFCGGARVEINGQNY